MSTQETLLLFDVHSLMNRAFYGIAGHSRLTAPDGFPTGALFAFLNMILKYREELDPSHIVSAMDMPGDTFRHDQYEDYKAVKDADFIVVVMSSASGVVKDVVDELRDQGIKAGCLRVRMFRPFPAEETAAALGNAKAVAVLDRALSIGGTAPLASEIKSALYDSGKSIPVQSCVYGLGGRDFFPQYARDLFCDLAAGKVSREERYLGLLE